MIAKIQKAYKNPEMILYYLFGSRFFRVIPDKLFVKIEYWLRTGRRLDLSNPETFNEKLQWLKLHDRNPDYTAMVDKLEVRKHVKETVGVKYLVTLIGVYKSYAQIDFSSLPDSFVLKPNHTSGDVFICKDKSKINHAKLKIEVNKWLNREYYWLHREWPYKNVKPKILCEQYLVDESGQGLKDYKFMCYNGVPKIVRVMSERRGSHYMVNSFDLEWNEIDLPGKFIRRNPNVPAKPKFLDSMIEISRVLSKGLTFVRIDMYETATKIYFGEITFYPASGFMDFKREKDDDLLGSWIVLPE